MIITLVVVVAGLVLRASPPRALAAGILFAPLIGDPFAPWNHHLTQWPLQICVVLPGFGMNLPRALRLGLNGPVFAAAAIRAPLLLGLAGGTPDGAGSKPTTLISACRSPVETDNMNSTPSMTRQLLMRLSKTNTFASGTKMVGGSQIW
jgi:uncharacterized membrane protein YadS